MALTSNYSAFRSAGGRLPEFDRLLNYLSAQAILNGALIEDIALGTTEVKVAHKLGRAYTGWFPVNLNANAVIYVSSTTLPNQFLNLKASASCTASIWVF